MRSAYAAALRTALLDCAGRGETDAALRALSPAELHFLHYDWQVWARDDQLAPEGDYITWLVLGGRGAGKTRAGAEWVRALALGGRGGGEPVRIALVGESLGDVRSIMVEGVSGLLSVHAPHERPQFEPSKRQVVWPNGAVAQMFSADDPESLRGPQFSAAWADDHDDPTNGATRFHRHDELPAWAVGRVPLALIGAWFFY